MKDTTPIAQVKRTIPLSFAQQRLWFIHKLKPQSHAYHIHKIMRFDELDIAGMEKALNAVVARHDCLRTVICERGKEVVQVISPELELELPTVDLSSYPPEKRAAKLDDIFKEETQKPFQFSQGPLIRAKVVRLSPHENNLILVVHHIVADGWSMGILVDELSRFYEAFSQGRSLQLPKVTQYADFVMRQRESFTDEAMEKQIRYWKARLKDAPVLLELPTDRPRPSRQSFDTESVFLEFSRDFSEAIEDCRRRCKVTLFIFLLSAWKLLLHRYTNLTDILIGSPVAGRQREEFQKTVGLFVNTLILRTDLSAKPTFSALLSRVRDTVVEAFSHQELPFEKIIEELRPRRSSSYTPYLQVVFTLLNMPNRRRGKRAGKNIKIDKGSAQFDLTIFITHTRQGMRGQCRFNKDIFDRETIEQLIESYYILLEHVVADPQLEISEIPILSDQRRQQIVHQWNRTQRDYPRDLCVHQIFEKQVEKGPEATALVFQQEHLSYGELNARANQLAHHLISSGVGPESKVGIFLDRSFPLIISILGVLKAGGAYVPIDTGYPEERIEFMLKDADTKVLIAHSSSAHRVQQYAKKVVCVDQWQPLSQLPTDNPENRADSGNLAYVMYTSGSSGIPKGVEICHYNINRLIFAIEYCHLDCDTVLLHMAPTSFDASTFEVWGALLHGGRCVLFPGALPTISELSRTLRLHSVNTLWLTASLFNIIVDEAPGILSGVRQLLTGGEALSVPHVRKAAAEYPEMQIINGYGPTESTTFACCYPLPKQFDFSRRSIPIGFPIANTQVYILDDQRRPVPVNVPGELYIAGDGLARGYLSRPEITAAKFVPNPFQKPGMKMYRTGDMARFLRDGSIEFLGRVDDQVKLRGFRIEPGEITAALNQHPHVDKSTVLRQEVSGEKKLVAYVVGNREITEENLRTFLKQKLPEYMVPSLYVPLESLPLSANGKVDHKKLPTPVCVSNTDKVSPRDKWESKLLKIWQKTLQIKEIGIYDDFFDLGGHSLLAIQMLPKIERMAGKPLPIEILLQAPTIAEMAESIRQELDVSQYEFLVPIQQQGSGKPFFCVHTGAGNVLMYRNLAHHLGVDRPFYGLRAKEIDEDNPTLRDVETMARDYLAEIKQVQSEGPYLIGGMCIGGLVALEIARKILEHGERVDLLAIIDTVNVPGMESYESRKKHKLKKLRFKAAALFRPKKIYEYAYHLANGDFEYIRAKLAKMKKKLEKRILPELNRHHKRRSRMKNSVRRVRDSYIPRPYPGKITLFRVGKADEISPAQLKFRELAQNGVECQVIPQASHSNLLKEPHVRELARSLRYYL